MIHRLNRPSKAFMPGFFCKEIEVDRRVPGLLQVLRNAESFFVVLKLHANERILIRVYGVLVIRDLGGLGFLRQSLKYHIFEGLLMRVIPSSLCFAQDFLLRKLNGMRIIRGGSIPVIVPMFERSIRIAVFEVARPFRHAT